MVFNEWEERSFLDLPITSAYIRCLAATLRLAMGRPAGGTVVRDPGPHVLRSLARLALA